MPVMPQTAETLVKKKHERIMNTIPEDGEMFNCERFFDEYNRYHDDLTLLNSPHIDRRPKK